MDRDDDIGRRADREVGVDPLNALPHADESVDALPDRSTAFFNALLTEHFVLESARGITVSESSSRAALYLTTLSSALVAFGFLADTAAATPFLAISIPVVCVLGLFTYERLVQTSLEDVAALDAMQHIRGYYAKLLPGADGYFQRPRGLHALNELLDIGIGGSRWNGFFTVSTAIAVVNSMVAGAGAAILVYRVADIGPTVSLGVVVAGAAVIGQLAYQVRRYERLVRILRAHRRPPTVPSKQRRSGRTGGIDSTFLAARQLGLQRESSQ